MSDEIKKPFVVDEQKRGAVLHTETADRIMKSYLVSDVELRSLNQCESHWVSGLSVGSFMLSVGIALVIEWRVNDYEAAIPAMVVSFLVAACFYFWGIQGWLDRRTVLKDIRDSSGRGGVGE